jgi:hypothetical protein
VREKERKGKKRKEKSECERKGKKRKEKERKE